ncbi:DUF2267 domain-containing protein [Ktedonosporobacter rubrisoli]|uniref:DUF2267 domain-containing protein n=1 Tax=Ktedonosporobacter rubrisoli TaxID=2509675 RepID=A0A4P6JTQ8_KTERU|nr:DUF2267 domain-containing protein [Ktedonosporobacter rubrisoli]QBD78715.1 DUF2267 domain-containing protein [Ktedonosporobacter rubrisoli]
MKTAELVKEVMHRAGLNSRIQAENAIRATLETISEHLTPEEAENFSAQLPPELASYMQQPFSGVAERFALAEFFERVSQREGIGLQAATFHARAVAAVVAEAITVGQVEHLRAQLPRDIAQLFNVQNAGEIPELKQ